MRLNFLQSSAICSIRNNCSEHEAGSLSLWPPPGAARTAAGLVLSKALSLEQRCGRPGASWTGINYVSPGSWATEDSAAAAAGVSLGLEDVKASPPLFRQRAQAQTLALRLGKPRRGSRLGRLEGGGPTSNPRGSPLPPRPAPFRSPRPPRAPLRAAVGAGNGCRAPERWEAALGPSAMWREARGRARGCRRVTAATGPLMSRWRPLMSRWRPLLLLPLVLLQAPPAVQASKRFLRSAVPRHSSLKIVGSVIFPVKVYAKLNHNSPRILCITNHLRNLELIDPVFQWNGPGGHLSSKNSSVKISPTGTLILRHFNLSGVYTCSIVYKLTAMQPHKNLLIKYLIYAYSDPKHYYEFTAQYHAAPCNSSHNTTFEKALLQILSKLVVELSCEVRLIKAECHHVKMQRGGLQNEIFFTFSEKETKGDLGKTELPENTELAKHLIEKFFKQQVEVSRKSSEPLPEIYYIDGTLQMVWVDRCYPGYGINAVMHPDCPECCVVCSPGSYNPSNGIHCLRCDRSLIYGATKC
ncbi:zona pellucida-binding protein 1 [Pterocles gutturalis]